MLVPKEFWASSSQNQGQNYEALGFSTQNKVKIPTSLCIYHCSRGLFCIVLRVRTIVLKCQDYQNYLYGEFTTLHNIVGRIRIALKNYCHKVRV